MFVAAYVYYKCNQEEVDKTVEIGREEAIRALANAGSTLQTTSALVFNHARRCYSSEERTSATESDGEDIIEMDSTSIVDSTPTSVTTSAHIKCLEHDIRQDWIDATFGKDFYASEHYNPPREGVGEAGIPSFVTFGATIPANANDNGQKVGVTLSSIAIGLYVRKVEPGSEAQCAGVQIGSILLDVNGLGMLGEPSRQALERLWQYDGSFHDNNSMEQDSSVAATTHQGPLVLRFYKKGKIYNALFFTKKPWGISWAPCGHFALVQKAYAFAEKAGVRRGCLVAAVNNRSIRDLDHEAAASEIRDRFVEGEPIALTFCYTPAASRCGFFQRVANGSESAPNTIQSPKSKRIIASADGVQVRAHPILWNNLKPNVEPHIRYRDGPMSELAARVVAGEVEAPSALKQMKLPPKDLSEIKVQKTNQFAKCPSLPKDQILRKWDSFDALLFCLQVCQANYDEDQLFAMIDGTSDISHLDLLRFVMKAEEAWKISDTFLLQWVSLMCLSIEEEEISKIDVEWISLFIKELSSQLLAMSRHDEDFCQRLYFVLRSFTATLEGQRKKDDTSKNLLTLLQALDRLRATEKQLMMQLSSATSYIRASSVDQPDRKIDSISCSQDPLLMPSSSAASFDGPGATSKKSKSRFKVFRKKQNGSGKVSDENTSELKSRHSTPDLVSINSESSFKQLSVGKRAVSLNNLTMPLLVLSIPSLFENMNRFLTELDGICDTIERSLLKSISQKIADWALQPWSDSKESELAKVTQGMRNGLQTLMASCNPPKPLVNPVESSELLVSVDAEECYILPSAHFPILLTFDVESKQSGQSSLLTQSKNLAHHEQLYRTKVEIIAIRVSATPMNALRKDSSDGAPRGSCAYIVQAAVAGTIKESGRSVSLDEKSKTHVWKKDGTLTFDTRSSWGAPKTLSLGVSTVSIGVDGHEQIVHSDEKGNLHYASEVGHCWVDMKAIWAKVDQAQSALASATVSCHSQVWSLQNSEPFDQQGELASGLAPVSSRLELELRITNQKLEFKEAESGYQLRKRMLLYKHDDDVRQEMFAIQFINVCDSILKASGLDLKLLTFRCVPVGSNRGFIEWIPGSVPLSEICQSISGGTFGRSASEESESGKRFDINGGNDPLSEVAKAGFFKYQSLPHSPDKHAGPTREVSLVNNPLQEYLRSAAYDANAPYYIQREVMDNYVKSCAGYCVLTYLLGVGDRHLDNLLLHANGYFFHCDYSFILGNDPKKYLPMRITEHMVHGMGGRESDNYARFLSLAGATFIALRRHENVRVVLSMVRLMIPSSLPDVSVNQSPEQAIDGILERFRLDLSDEKALSYMEQLIEDSICSKMWMAVDAMHKIAKIF